MSICALVAALLLGLALLAHLFVGTAEYRTIAPAAEPNATRQAWVQGLGAWHFVTVDLLVTTLLFAAVGLGDWMMPVEAILLRCLGVYFLVQGIVWLLVLSVSGHATPNRYLKLPQWLLFWIVAGLAFAAS
ncbi:MAG: hypothetical protein AAFU85_23830 [Planctomycetota bacterium]